MTTSMPVDIQFGKVTGRFLLAVADTNDLDSLPDAKGATGQIIFTPLVPNMKVAEPATVVRVPIRCTVDDNGYVIDAENNRGVWLVTGQYRVTYSLTGALIPTHVILVTTDHTNDWPLDLTNVIPPSGPTLSPSQYSELNARIDGLYGAIPDVPVVSVNNKTGFVSLSASDVGALEIGDHIDWSEVDNKPATYLPSVHQHTSADVTDWREAVQDALAAFFNVTGATATYDDENNQIVINVPESGANPEDVRDLIGAAMIGVGLITVSVNDAADTITISTTATQNSTDAQLRDRSTHTGTQAISTISGLQPKLDSHDISIEMLSGPRFRGTWSAIQKLKGYDLSAGVPSGLTQADGVSVLATSSTQAPGTPPGSASVLRVGTRGTANQTGRLRVTAPTGTSQIRFKHGHQYAPGGYGSYSVSVNGTVVRSGAEVQAAWQTFQLAILAGQVFDVNVPLQYFGGANYYTGESYIADLEFWGTGEPYHAGDTVYYNNLLYQAAVEGTTSTPGANSDWTLMPINSSGVGGRTWLAENGRATPAALLADGAAVNSLVYEKALPPQDWDFTQGALPAGWNKFAGTTETFDGTGMTATFDNLEGYYYDGIGVMPANCVFEIEMLTHSALTSNIMIGPALLNTSGNTGVGATWYQGSNGLLVIGISGRQYSGSASTLVTGLYVPVRMRIRRSGGSFYAGVSQDNGASWSETPNLNSAVAPDRLSIIQTLGGQVVNKIKSARYIAGTATGAPRGWWNGSSLQPLA